MPIRQAAVEGSKEIFFAVLSTSITLAIVFLPGSVPCRDLSEACSVNLVLLWQEQYWFQRLFRLPSHLF